MDTGRPVWYNGAMQIAKEEPPMISPALHFQGDCLEAIALYEQAYDGTEKSVQLYDTAPDGSGLNMNGDMPER